MPQISHSSLIFILTLFCSIETNAQRGQNDLVSEVLSLIFKPNYQTFSGYLYANKEKTWKMHYVLTTSRENKSQDIVFWFNGGPGYSSVIGSFRGMGPMYADKNGSSLFENIYSWNRAANMVYLESPIGVGFSYDTTNVHYYGANDNQTMEQNFNAIFDFFENSHPEYKNRDFYLAGESYAGIYIPTLAQKIALSLPNFPNKNFKGLLIGNALLSPQLNFNTQILWSYFHGLIGEDDWSHLKECCDEGKNVDECNWYALGSTKNKLDFTFNMSTPCGKVLDKIINPIKQIDMFNFFQDCYEQDPEKFRSQQTLSKLASKNPASYFNRQSTDPNQGYACYSDNTAEAYFNRSDVANAFHIDKEFYEKGGFYQAYNDPMGQTYDVQYDDMTPQFETVLDKIKGFRILIFNGDIDPTCNFIGDARFIKNLVEKRGAKSIERTTWFFRKQLAGYVQRYTDPTSSVIDVLTIKDAGHMSPMDRPGPAFQMFSKFMANEKSYGNLEDKNEGIPENLPYKEKDENVKSFGLKNGLLNLMGVMGLLIFFYF